MGAETPIHDLYRLPLASHLQIKVRIQSKRGPQAHGKQPLGRDTRQIALAHNPVGAGNRKVVGIVVEPRPATGVDVGFRRNAVRHDEIMRFGLDDGSVRTLEQVGTHFQVTRERVRQIENKALAKLRQPARAKQLDGYLESG